VGRFEDLIDAMYALHSETDEAARSVLLDQAVTDDVRFHGLQVELFGRDEFGASFRDGGTYLVRTSAVEHRAGWLRCTWELQEEDGSVARADDGEPYVGVQFSRLGPDGRLQQIVPFRGLVPPPAP
jgi:hypothetical protein